MVVDLTHLLQLTVNGLVLGSILALSAVGLTLVYGILDLANFAHGDLLTLGAYLGLFFVGLVTVPTTLTWALGVAVFLEAAVLADRLLRPFVAGMWDRIDPEPGLSDREAKLLLYGVFVLLAMVAGLIWDPAVGGDLAVLLALSVALGGLLLAAWRSRALEAKRGHRSVLIALVLAPILTAVLVFGLGPLAGWSVTWPFGLAVGLLVPAGTILARSPGLLDRPLAGRALGLAGLLIAGLLVSRLLLAIALALLLVGLLTVVLDLLIWRPMRGKDAGLLTLIIISIGLALALRNGIIITWGTGVVDFPGSSGGPLQVLPGVLVTRTQLIVIGITLVTIGLVHALLRHTALGKAMRALADDMDLARISGIDVDRVILYVWFISGALAALAGVLLGMLRPFTTSFGWFLLLPIFAAVILGGIGSPYGAMAGGFVIGLSMETSLAFGVPSDYRLAVGFAIMILVLIFRPQGIFGGQATR